MSVQPAETDLLQHSISPLLAGQALTLAPIEHYFVADQRADYPLTFLSMATLTGQVDRPAFERAMAVAVARTPFLSARLQTTSRGRSTWQIDQTVAPVVKWVDGEWPLDTASLNTIDLRNEPGIRTWVGQWQGLTRVVMQIHHACVDGVGSCQFVGDLVTAYARELERGVGHELRPIEPATLEYRLKIERPAGPRPSLWRVIRFLAIQTNQFFNRRPIILQPSQHTKDKPAPALFPNVEERVLDENQAAELRTWSTAHGATANEALLAVFYQTLAQWNALHPGPGKWLRVLVPTNLRGLKHQETPACNLLGFAFLDRRPDECNSPVALLPEIVRQLGLVKKNLLGRTFLDAIAVVHSLGLLQWMTSACQSTATAVFSNPGDPSRRFLSRLPKFKGKPVFGNLILEAFTGVTPLRPGTRVGLLVTGNQTRLNLTWNTDPNYFTAEDRAALIARYEANLQAMLAGE
ncbi:acyltransferase PapA5 [Anatilimnocola aggregata]|uniref:Acyltransferase PapA5 n=1 Tax=Anatilimnocola aggregata TaxID=2528021 RepID=A0A517YCQ5_9BACT|nr:hypothetical protein [Anatilimnocola aggregata]QDU28026.1 acyltransferase PapA5 [Anatilimnocola aggregata]